MPVAANLRDIAQIKRRRSDAAGHGVFGIGRIAIGREADLSRARRRAAKACVQQSRHIDPVQFTVGIKADKNLVGMAEKPGCGLDAPQMQRGIGGLHAAGAVIVNGGAGFRRWRDIEIKADLIGQRWQWRGGRCCKVGLAGVQRHHVGGGQHIAHPPPGGPAGGGQTHWQPCAKRGHQPGGHSTVQTQTVGRGFQQARHIFGPRAFSSRADGQQDPGPRGGGIFHLHPQAHQPISPGHNLGRGGRAADHLIVGHKGTTRGAVL